MKEINEKGKDIREEQWSENGEEGGEDDEKE